MADTILLAADHFHDGVLSGGSAVRNITRIYRLTYDIDFDTEEEDFEEICNTLKEANKKLGGARSLREYRSPGLITFKLGRNVRASFDGVGRLAPFVRWISKLAYLNLHIMRIPDMHDMFTHYDKMKLETVIPVDATVRTATRKYLFYRKALRANKETRVEDFIDLALLIGTSPPMELQTLIRYCCKTDKKSVVLQGLRNLVSKKADFINEVEDRLTYVTLDMPYNQWVDNAAETLESFSRKLK